MSILSSRQGPCHPGVRTIPSKRCRVCLKARTMAGLCPECSQKIGWRLSAEVKRGDTLAIQLAKQMVAR